MSDKIRKYKERASRLIAKGKYDDALEEYEKCIKIDPRDLSVRQKLAETHARIGNTKRAVSEYMSVAGSYAADGLLLKAIAINKVILSLDPHHKDTQDALANLYAKKRGDFGGGAVSLPKAMTAAVGKRSANEIRGTPAGRVGPGTSPGATPPALPADAEADVIDLDGESLEVLEEVSPTLGAQITTNLSDIAAIGQSRPMPPSPPPGASVDASVDLDISIDMGEPVSVEEPAVVVGTAVPSELPPDEMVGVIVDDGGDDDLFELEETEIQPDELPPIPLFSDLSKNAFITLTERMDLHQAEAGEILIAEGEYAASMYIVIQGKVKVVRELEGGQELKLAELSDGSFFGEMALLSDAPRTASVIAVEDTMLFEISRDLVEDVTKQYPSVEQVMKRFHRNRLLTNLLRTSPIFAPFSAADKKDLIEKFKSRNVPPGKILITREKPGDGLYVLLSGRCDVVSRDKEDRDVVIAELKEGDVFGEMSMLWKQLTTASVRTSTPCIVLRLPKKDFDTLIMTHPQVLETLSSMSEAREAYNKDLLNSGEDMLQDVLL